jgi:hypothetical protein
MLAALVLVLAPNLGMAGIIHPAYERHLNTLPEDTQVSVIIHLSEQVPIAALDAELRAEEATLAARHERVITSLQQTAAATQGPLLADLAARQAQGKVQGFTPYWISNLVVAEMAVRDVREVAARADVDFVEANFTVSLIEPVGGITAARDDPEQLAAATPGVRAINAPRVWSELGITGAGRLIGGLDTGVRGTHTALAARWRGAQPGILWQWAWLDLLGTNTQFPNDGNGHGTHTMGTMVGLGAATQDTVGVAWRAQWIACNAINQGVNPGFDNDIIAAFQWFADPDGNSQTTSDVPDAVQNSWRVNESFGYPDCDTRWYAVIDGCEAAGCAVVFSAGNEGPGAETIGSPPDRITTPTNGYAIGAVDATNFGFPFPIAGFSSRGPSGCDHVTKKPEVVGPGVAVRSSTGTSDNSYGNSDGTSMAGPHIAGMFALLREANPNLDVTTMKQIIMDTSRDLGAAGEDNTFGWGIPDAYAAVSTVLKGVGEIEGTVTASGLGEPVPNATVTVLGPNRSFTTSPLGEYHGFVGAGTFDVQATHPAFQTATQTGVVIDVDQVAQVDFVLNPLPDAVPPQVSNTTCLFATDDTAGPYVIETTATDNSGFVVARLHYRIGQNWVQVPMSSLGGNRFAGNIPGQTLGTSVDYYVEALDAQQNSATDPAGAPGVTFTFTIAVADPVLVDDGEQDLGWTLGVAGDQAITGRWVREDPVGTTYQPENDHSPVGTLCFITGNAPPGSPDGQNDVDGGCTTLLSPVFDVAGADEAVVRYWRWYTNETSLDDDLLVDISSDGGATWQPFERVTETRQPWIEVEKSLRCQINLTNQMRLRFIACDQATPSLTEAGVDDVFIGKFAVTTGVANPGPAPAGRFGLVSVHPNPFNPSVMVTYDVPSRTQVGLRIYDVHGRLVRTLADGVLEAGMHTAIFDGRNDGGHDVASGTYFLELEASGQRATEKLSLLR